MICKLLQIIRDILPMLPKRNWSYEKHGATSAWAVIHLYSNRLEITISLLIYTEGRFALKICGISFHIGILNNTCQLFNLY